MDFLRFLKEEHLLEGKMEDELSAQIKNQFNRDDSLFTDFKTKYPDGDIQISRTLAKKILEIDPSKKKSFRFKIKDWVLSGSVDLRNSEDLEKLTKDLTLYVKTGNQNTDFKTLNDFQDAIEVEMFNYTFDVDYSDKRFTIHIIHKKDEKEFSQKLGCSAGWCIANTNKDESWFGDYELPYYLLIDKKNKKQYAIVPSGGQFKDARQDDDNSRKKFEEFDKILNLRERYYFNYTPTEDNDLYTDSDLYIYKHPLFDKADSRLIMAVMFEESIKYSVNSEGGIDIDGDIAIYNYHIRDGKMTIPFGHITGDFDCSNKKLTSLEGSPSKVGGHFNCSDNKLTSLEGSPSKVGGHFNCSYNDLTNLEGSPSKVGGHFNCIYNDLTNLEGSPSKVGGDFNCSYNELTSLEGSPSKVGGDFFYGDKSKFKSLDGIGEVKGKIAEYE